jgi:tryptophan synthase alpha chain
VRLDSALRDALLNGRTIVVPYLLVDRGRRRRVRAIVEALAEAGATALELGFPFSEPIADGPYLAAAHARSLANGTTWSDLIADLRVASPILPTAVMTYANPLQRRGLDRSLGALAAAGATGLIVPDLSLEESPPFRGAARRHRISLVLLAAPGVPPARLTRIAGASQGFLYLVGHYGTTGGPRQGARVDLRPIVTHAHAAAPSLPILVGFGVRDRASAARALASGADGIVVGTAIEQILSRGPPGTAIRRFVRSIAGAERPRRRR